METAPEEASVNIALSYCFSPFTVGYHIERALEELGHHVTYVGLPHACRPGYHNDVSVDDLVRSLPVKSDLFLWVESGGRSFPPGVERLPIPTAAYIIDAHIGEWRTSFGRFFDAVFVAQRDFVSLFRDALGHQQVFWLPLGCSKECHQPLGLERIYDVGFIGNVGLAHRGTPRSRRLGKIENLFTTNDLYGSYSWEELCRVYNQSRIVFNTSTSLRGDVSMRIFEGTACGALVMTDSASNGLGDLYSVGEEIVVYNDDEDLIEKIRYYLSHDGERNEIAGRGQQRALRDHSYEKRVSVIIDLVSGPGFKLEAPLRSAGSAVLSREQRIIYTHLHMVDGVLDVAKREGSGLLGRVIALAPALIRRLLV